MVRDWALPLVTALMAVHWKVVLELAVGYGTDGCIDYLKVKNCLGASWGATGLFLLQRGKSGSSECGHVSGTPVKNSRGAIRGKIGLFWLPRGKRGSGECGHVSGTPTPRDDQDFEGLVGASLVESEANATGYMFCTFVQL